MLNITDQTDYYELLEVDPDATADQIKKAYRKAAMKWHPDRNFGKVEEATRVFQLIEHAYSILSDDHERAWYDGHKNLATDDDGSIQATHVDIMGLFSARAYFGFEDNPKGFYNVFGEAFKQMAEEEPIESPPFGGPNTPWEDVDKFYSFWTVFKTKRNFGFADLYRLKEAPNAVIRRAMSQENKKARQKAEQGFLSSVHELALYVRKRDPRVSDHIAQMEEEKARREAEAEVKRKEQQKKVQEDLEKYINEPKIDYTEDDLRYVRQFDQDQKADGEPDWNCSFCNREMKNESAFRSHCKTKKHQKNAQNAKKRFMLNPSSMEHTPLNYVLLCLSSEEIEELTGETIDIENEPLFVQIEEEEEEDIDEMEEGQNKKQKKPLTNKEKRKQKIQQEKEKKEKELEEQSKIKQNEKLSKKEKQKQRQQEQLAERQKIKEERKEKAEKMPKLSKKEKRKMKQQEDRIRQLKDEEEEDIPEPEIEHDTQIEEIQLEQPEQPEQEDEPPKQEEEAEQPEEEQTKGKQQKGKKGKKGKNEEKDTNKTPIQRAPKNMKNPPPGMFMCRSCRQLFPSKRKLFLHLEETKHATAY